MESSTGPQPKQFDRRIVGAGFGGTIVIVVALALAFAWPGFLNEGAYAFKGGFYEPPNQAADLPLTDQNQQPFSLEAHRGKVVLVFFGYTYCPNYCPTTLLEVQKVKDKLGDKAADVDVVFVSVDPDRDSPDRLKQYLAFFDPAYIGLTGDQSQIDAVKVPYGVRGDKQPPDAAGQYLVDHTTSLYAIDPDGNLRLTWAYGTAPEDIASDVEHIL